MLVPTGKRTLRAAPLGGHRHRPAQGAMRLQLPGLACRTAPACGGTTCWAQLPARFLRRGHSRHPCFCVFPAECLPQELLSVLNVLSACLRMQGRQWSDEEPGW